MQRSSHGRRRHSPAQRDRTVAAYQRSQLTQRKFAAQAGIGYSTLTLWLRKAATVKPIARPAFVPVPNLLPAAAAGPAYRLQFPQGVTVDVAPGFQAAELAALLQVVQTL